MEFFLVFLGGGGRGVELDPLFCFLASWGPDCLDDQITMTQKDGTVFPLLIVFFGFWTGPMVGLAGDGRLFGEANQAFQQSW